MEWLKDYTASEIAGWWGAIIAILLLF